MKVAILAAVAAMIMSMAPASAREGAWCQRSRVTGGNPQCSFASFQQCQATISGIGGDCIRNPRMAYGNWRGGPRY